MNEHIANIIEKATAEGAKGAINLGSKSSSQTPNIISLIGSYPPEKLFLMIMFSLLGTGYFIYGKKTGQYSIILTGIVLFFVSHIFSTPLFLFLAGTGVALLPHLLKRL